MSKPRIKDIQIAVVNAIKDSTALSWIPDDQIQEASDRNIDFINQEIIVTAPAVIVLYTGAGYQARNTNKTKYDIYEKFLLIAVAENRRGIAESLQGSDIPNEYGVLEIIEGLKDAFAGVRLTVSTGVYVYPSLLGVSMEGVTPAGEICYGLEIETGGNWG